MSLIGKILALVNILAAVAFIYVAASDYGKRKQWSYAVYRHELAIDGLPLDEKEQDVDGRQRVKDLSQPTLSDMFQQAGGQPVSTQMAELQNVQNSLRQKIDDGQPMAVPNPLVANAQLTLTTPAQKRAWFLLPVARTLIDRDALLTQLPDDKVEKIDAAAFDKPFSEIQTKADPGDKRQAIAELLFALLDATTDQGQQPQDLFDSQGYKRFVTVVGRRAAAAAVDNQAAVLMQLARETDDLLAAGRAAFAAQHGREVIRIRDLADVALRETDNLEVQTNRVARQKQLVAERDSQVKELQSRLAAARKTTRAYLAEQAKLQEAILKEQGKLRDANQENRKLLREIETLEQGSRD